MPPPIRYPLPTLVALVVLALVAWRGGDALRGLRDAASARWRHLVEGPPVPATDRPRTVAGGVVRRALILREGTPVSARPGASPTDAIARRMFVDVYDPWPLIGEPTDLRVGNRSPIGWVAAADCLEWPTRLVVSPPGGRLKLADGPDAEGAEIEVGEAPLPVVGWRGGRVELVVWERGRPWSVVARRGWASVDDVPRASLGVLLAGPELPALLAMVVAARDPEARDRARLRAVLGRLVEPAGSTSAEVAAAVEAMPAWALARPGSADPAGRLAATNAGGPVAASWGGIEFRFVSLDDLP